MTTTATLRPNGHSNIASAFTIVGGSASVEAATSDNSDSTYITEPNGAPPSVRFEFTDSGAAGIPSTARILSVTPRLRWLTSDTVTTTQIRAHIIDPAGSFGDDQLGAPGQPSTFRTDTLTARSTRSDGASWAISDIDAIALYLFVGLSNPSIVQIAELYLDVAYNSAPTATVSTPSNLASRPTVSWTYADADGDAQERYRVKVFDSVTYGGVGFDPETSTPVYDSGEVFSSATSVQVSGVDLVNGTTYKAYVKVGDVGSGTRYGAWASSASWTAVIDPVGKPSMFVVFDPLNYRMELTIQGHANMLSADTADLEGGLGDWTINTNSTLFSSNAITPLHGTKSMQVIASGTSNIAIEETAHLHPVVGGGRYTFSGWVKAATAGRLIYFYLHWWDASFTDLGYTNNNGQQTSIGSSPSAWTFGYADAVAPPNAAYVSCGLYITAPGGTNEVQYFDELQLVPGSCNLIPDPNNAAQSGNFGNAFNAPAPTITYDTTYARTGTISVKVVAGSNGNQVSPIGGQPGQVIEANADYTFTFWAYSPTGVTLNNLLVSWFNGSGTFISSSFLGSTVVVPAGVWTRCSVTATAPSSAVFGHPRIDMAASTTCWFDDSQFEKVVNLVLNPGAEIDTGYWTWSTDTPAPTITRDTGTVHSGTGSVKVITGSSGNGITCGTGQFYVRGRPGHTYRGQVWVRPVANATISLEMWAIFEQAEGGSVTSLGATTQLCAGGAWTLLTVTGTVPANSDRRRTIELRAHLPASTTTYLDDSSLVNLAGSPWHDTTWAPGGYLSNQAIVVERSTDNVTWTAIRATGATGISDSTPGQALVVFDPEAPRGVPVYYRTRVLTSNPSTTASPNTPQDDITTTLVNDGTHRLYDPIAGTGMRLFLHDSDIRAARTEPQTVWHPLGRTLPLVTSDVVGGKTFQLSLSFHSDADFDTFEILRAHQRALLWSTPAPGRQWYIRLGETLEEAWDTVAMADTTDAQRVVSIPAVEVAAP